MVRLALEVSQDFDDLLEKLSVKLKTDKAGVFKKAIALYKFCSEESDKGLKIGTVDGDGKLGTEFNGV